MSSVEMVVLFSLVPVFLVMGIGAGRLVLADGRVSAAAAAAARAASLETSPAAARQAATRFATSTLKDTGTTCSAGHPGVSVDTGDFHAAGRVTVTVTCRVDLGIARAAGFGPHRDLSATAGAPLDARRSYRGQP
ncbi:ATP/GTP-binding protein [Kineosporia sp. J2-2]|uniref:ATP/GTP-binding protein n=1 Tax=Kineosporia corallincola TaxID=2835133 RepID=A0ABS5TTZ2_9ACTN|nr:ATP/GTP-binding protein [Kineosporia corallincola]MBT0774270.1 ATP/GTP-binding protein [Kineosporia corallincola]